MAIAMMITPKSMTADQYREITDRLEAAGAGEMLERSFHACFGSGDQLRIFDVWDTEEALRETLDKYFRPVLAEVGVEFVRPEIVPLVRAVS